MTLKELEQQIVSEAVKAFREKRNALHHLVRHGSDNDTEIGEFGYKTLRASDDGSAEQFTVVDWGNIESFLTDQLHQATWKVAEEHLKLLEQHRNCKDQPCDNFKTSDHLYNSHECPECDASGGPRHFCDNCHRDHHDGGWRSCCIPSIIKAIKDSWLNHNSEEKCAEKDCNNKRLPPNDFCQFHCDNLPF